MSVLESTGIQLVDSDKSEESVGVATQRSSRITGSRLFGKMKQR